MAEAQHRDHGGEMNSEQKSKQRFVDRRLAPLMQSASGNDVSAVAYLVEAHEEFVRIRFRNGYEKRVCVTGDSLKALAVDCLRAIG